MGSCLLLAACGNGMATDGVVDAALTVLAGGDVRIEFVLADQQSDPADVELRFSVDSGSSWTSATVKTPRTGLLTSPLGTRHELTWDALSDLGPRARREVRLALRSTATLNGEVGRQFTATTRIDNVPVAARAVETFMIHLGALDAAAIAIAETCDLVILYPCDPSVTRSVVAEIQDGVDALDPTDDVLVLGYVDIGEDQRTVGISDPALRLDPRFVGDGTGPRVDPRGPNAAGQPLVGLDPLGAPSVAGGYASFYLDDNSIESNGVGDGLPDRNRDTGACYVNMGDPAWYAALDAMRCGTADGLCGFRELLTRDYGLGLGCDGVLLDNVDTCAPDIFTGPSDPDQAEFEWTAAGCAACVDRLRTDYPEALIAQGRGLFFFEPQWEHYKLTTGAAVDFVLLTDYRLDRDPTRTFDAFAFADNKFNQRPKLQAEANRSDGFRVLSLGFASGPGIDPQTLVGTSTQGLAILLEDIVQAQELAGYRHYLTDADDVLVNGFVRDHSVFTDTTAPVWDSTYNANNAAFPTPPGAPDPRVGIQEVVAGVESVRVRWDAALDLHPVHYVLYYQPEAFAFGQPDPFAGARRLLLRPASGAGYQQGAAAGVYPYEAIVAGLGANATWFFCIRAVDTVGNEDQNQVVLSATTLPGALAIRIDGDFADWHDVPVDIEDRADMGASAGPDWKRISVTNDAENLYIHFETHEPFDLVASPTSPQPRLKIFLDVDDDPFTGFRFDDIGSELLVHGDRLIAQTRGGGLLQTLSAAPVSDVTEGELAVPLAAIHAAAGGAATRIRMIFLDAGSGDRAPDRSCFAYVIRP